jgi:hypothetical protein
VIWLRRGWGVGLPDRGQFLADDRALLDIVAQDAFELRDGLAQLGHLLLELRAPETREAGQLHVEDVLGLFGRELERCGHERLARRGLVFGGAYGGDDLVDEIECLEQTFDDMGASLRLVESVLRTTGDDLDLVIDVGDERVAKVERARNAIDESHGVDREVGLQRRALVEVVEDDESRRVALEAQDDPHPALGRFVVEVGDAVELTVVDQFLDLHDELVGAHLVGQFCDDDEVGARAFLDLGLAPQLDRSATGPVRVQDPLTAHDERTGREVGTLHERHQIVRSGLWIGEEMVHRVDDLGEVVRRDIRGHAHRDALRAVYQQVGETAGENNRFLELAGVVVDEVDGVLVDIGEHVERHRGETALRVASGGRWFVERTEVALRMDERMAQRERLAHAHERVVDRGVAMRVVLAHYLAGDSRALHRRAIGKGAQVVHAPEDATVDGLEPVARVGKRTRHDDGHRVVEERAFHLLLDLDRFDRAEGGAGGLAVVRRCGVAHREVWFLSWGGLLRCRGTARPWRWSG